MILAEPSKLVAVPVAAPDRAIVRAVARAVAVAALPVVDADEPVILIPQVPEAPPPVLVGASFAISAPTKAVVAI